MVIPTVLVLAVLFQVIEIQGNNTHVYCVPIYRSPWDICWKAGGCDSKNHSGVCIPSTVLLQRGMKIHMYFKQVKYHTYIYAQVQPTEPIQCT